MSDLVKNPEDRFSHNEAQLSCCQTQMLGQTVLTQVLLEAHLYSQANLFEFYSINFRCPKIVKEKLLKHNPTHHFNDFP